MKKILLTIAIITTTIISTYAGNPDRQGQAGAQQLLINNFARSSGWGWANVASVSGLDAGFLNPAGYSNRDGIELAFSYGDYLRGTDIGLNSFGFVTPLGSEGSLAVSFNSMNMGDIEITTEGQPNGGLGTYRPQLNNIGLGYARKFTDRISGGFTLRFINESIPSVKSNGFALDAGVQYGTSMKKGKKTIKGDDIHFGVSIKNLGPNMTYGGEGLGKKVVINETDYEATLTTRAEAFNLPSLLNIGVAYDIKLDKGESYKNKLVVAGNFTNHSFSNNQTTLGLEYSYAKTFFLRTGYAFEKGLFKEETQQTAFNGFHAGMSLDIAVRKDDRGSDNRTRVGIDYSFRGSNVFGATHTFGLTIKLGSIDN